jgi:hypothetical protein
LNLEHSCEAQGCFVGFSLPLYRIEQDAGSQCRVISIELFLAYRLRFPTISLAGGLMEILKNQKGATGWILLWAIGIPIPILVLLFMVRGCT